MRHTVFSLLLLATIARGVNAADALPPIRFATACGPIAIYCALRELNCEEPLENVIRKCRWQDDSLTSLRTMCDVLESNPNVRVEAVRLTPEQLARFVSGSGVAIVPIRTHSYVADHAVCVINAHGSELTYFGYPDLTREVSANKLTAIWDGEALLVSPSIDRWWVANAVWFVLPAVSIAALALSLARSRVRKA